MKKFSKISTNRSSLDGIFGMKIIEENDKKRIHVKAYCEEVVSVEVISVEGKIKSYPLDSTDEPYVFEGIIGRRLKPFKYILKGTDQDGGIRYFTDCNQFEPWITKEEELSIINGVYYDSYKKLGAHIQTLQGVKGISFAVWAPQAEAVSVVGTFNAWDGRRNPMRKLESSGIWELFIPHISLIDTTYKYEIKTTEGVLLYKADPYALYAEKRPNTASKIWDQESYKWKDDRWMSKRSSKAYSREGMTIYEVHIGSWKRHENGTFYNYREVAHELSDYVKEMGYTHVELMGIMEHPFDGSWGYQVGGYFAPTSRYGTPDDFKYFIEVMHKNQIGVILDWVPGHFPKDAFGLEQFDGTPLYEYSNKAQAEHPEWGTLVFDYGKNGVRNFLISSALSWIDRYHIDGLRVDAVASMLYLNYAKEDEDSLRNEKGGYENLEAMTFIQMLNQAVKSRFKGVMMIAEESTAWKGVTAPVEEGGLGFDFKWNMGWMNDFLAYMQTDPLYRKYEHHKITFSLMYAFNEHFILPLSHDEVVHGKSPMLYKMPGDEWRKFANLRLAYAYLFMHPGKKMLFMGNEFGQTSEWSEARALDWHLLQAEPHEKLQRFMKDLNYFYRKHKCLWEVDDCYEGFEWIDCENKDESVISFVRKAQNPKNHLIIIANFTPVVRQNVRIGVPYEGTYEEVLNSDNLKYFGSGVMNHACDTEEIESGIFPVSIELTIPPLALTVLQCRKPIVPSSKQQSRPKKK